VTSARSTTIRGCTFSGNAARQGGAAACFATALTITDSRFEQNRAEDPIEGGGGALWILFDTTGSIENSSFTDNHAINKGGAISFGIGENNVTLRRITITGCSAVQSGGAIDFSDPTHSRYVSYSILDSTLSGNHADVSGGAIYVGGGNDVRLVNSTLSANSAPRGGAISIDNAGPFDGTGAVVVLNSTIAFNDAPVGAGIDAPGFATAELGRSILFGSTGGPDCEGSIASLGHNVFGSATPCTLTGDTSTDLLGVDPLLGPLQDNGGPTFTHELLAGSPAIDAAADTCVDDAGAVLTADQRGALRPDDGDGNGIAACDIGAVEACGADSDGDTLGDACDCAPGDPTTMRVPTEADVRVAKDVATDDAILTWADLGPRAGSGTLYDVASDSVGALWARRVADAACVATAILGPFVDARLVTDRGWYYLVRGINACGPAVGQGWGRDSLGAARPACP
jgi:hypothetical protein